MADYFGDATANRLSGGAEDDTFYGYAGNDTLKGGGGTDTAVFSGSILDYSWSATMKGFDITGPDGTDSLESIEVFRFDDYSFDTQGGNETGIDYELNYDVMVDGTLTFTVTAWDFDDPNIYVTVFYPNIQTLDVTTTSVGNGTIYERTYELDPASRDSLAVGESYTIDLEYRIYGGNYEYQRSEYGTVTVWGVNDDPTMWVEYDEFIVAEEDGVQVRFDLTVLGDDIDSDDDGTTLTYEIVSPTTFGQVWIEGTELVFDPLSDYQHLYDGERIEEVLQLRAIDAHGGVSNIVDFSVFIDGTRDALPSYLTAEGAIDYTALGVDPASEPAQGVVNGIFSGPSVIDWVNVYTDGSDTVLFNGTGFLWFVADSYFYDLHGSPYTDLSIDTGDGADKVVYRLTGETTEFVEVELGMGVEDDQIFVLDMDASLSAVVSGVVLGTDGGNDQVLIDIDSAGSASYRTSTISTGAGDDLIHMTVRATGENSAFGVSSFSFFNTTFNMGEGGDTLIIDLDVTDGGSIEFAADIHMWEGDDYVRVDNLDSTISPDYPYDPYSGFTGSIDMSWGDDVLDFRLKAQDGESAIGYLDGGEGFDVLNLWGKVADWSIEVVNVGYYYLTKGGQEIRVSSFEAIYAEDGKITPVVSNSGKVFLDGTGDADELFGTSADEVIRGFDFADTLHGGGGHDQLDGGQYDDVLYGDAGNDTLTGDLGADFMDGGDGSDFYFFDGTDVIADSGATGTDWMYLERTNESVQLDLDDTHGIERITTLGGYDKIDATDVTHDLTIETGRLNDTVLGGAGSDFIDGGAQNDFLVGDNSDPLMGSEGDDTIVGTSGNDLISGGAGRNLLLGGAGDDFILAGYGQGDDTINGGAGNDTLYTAGGRTTFVFEDGFGHDTVYFGGTVDVIDLSAMTGVDSEDDLIITMNGDDGVIRFVNHADTITVYDINPSWLDWPIIY